MALQDIVDQKLFTIGGTVVTLSTFLTGVVIVVLAAIASRVIRAAIRRAVSARGVEDDGSVRVAGRLVHYVIMAVSIAIALQTAGVELTALFAAGAVFAVGIGFAMQNIVQNFVSGVILLVERSIRPGDIVEFDGRVARVREMGIRATIVRTRDDEDVIVPNGILVQQAVKNLTLNDSTFRIRVGVGVSYGSDLTKVRAVLEEVANGMDFRSEKHKASIFLADFGASSVDFKVAVVTLDPWVAPANESALREAIWWAFQEAKIEISFPQLDVHLDRPALEALRARAA